MTKYLATLYLLLFLLNLSAQDRKFQIWNHNSFDVSLSEKTKIGISEKIHYTPKTGTVNLKFVDLILEYQFVEWFKAGAGARLLWINKEYGWVQERRPMVFAKLSFSIRDFEIGFSDWFDYRIFDIDMNYLQNRQKITLDFPAIYQTNLQFYTAFEAIHKFCFNEFYLARWYAGLNTIQREHFSLQLFYVFEKNRSANLWTTTDIIGINIKIGI